MDDRPVVTLTGPQLDWFVSLLRDIAREMHGDAMSEELLQVALDVGLARIPYRIRVTEGLEADDVDDEFKRRVLRRLMNQEDRP